MITGLLLAAGAGRRLGAPKAELVLGGTRLIDRAVQVLREGGCEEVLAVVRSALVIVDGARTVVNPTPDEGMGSSLRCGLAALPPQCSACVVLLVDLPAIRAAEVAAVIEAHRAGAELVAVRRAGLRSHPVLVGRGWYPEFAAAAVGDEGGRGFFRAHQAATVFIDYPEPIRDIDTVEDLRAAELSLAEPERPKQPVPSETPPPAE